MAISQEEMYVAGWIPRLCNHHDCTNEGFDTYDYYGIYAGKWCDEHESEAPGQWAYAGADTEPLDEDI